jgi:hypothetical protein
LSEVLDPFVMNTSYSLTMSSQVKRNLWDKKEKSTQCSKFHECLGSNQTYWADCPSYLKSKRKATKATLKDELDIDNSPVGFINHIINKWKLSWLISMALRNFIRKDVVKDSDFQPYDDHEDLLPPESIGNYIWSTRRVKHIYNNQRHRMKIILILSVIVQLIYL